jgi:hypothetical protein
LKSSYPDSSSRLKALVAATPLLGAAARSLSRNSVVDVIDRAVSFITAFGCYKENAYA